MLYLVRHAHAPYSPDEMRSLSAAGHLAARQVAEVLAPLGIERIYSSPYTRALETVQPLAERLGQRITVDEDLRERRLSAGPLDDFAVALAATWQDFDLILPGGESSRAAQSRVAGAIRRIVAQSPTRTVSIATHGNALALFLRTLDASIDHAFWSRMTTPDVFVIDTPADASWTFARVWKG